MRRKVSALRTEEYFHERAGRADRRDTLRILARAGAGNAPMAGDELPATVQKKRKKQAPRKSTHRK
jgi:hypothetical protein